MASPRRIALWLFSIGLAGLGVLGLVVGDFALQWQPVAPWVPGRRLLAYAAAVLMLGLAPALLLHRTAKTASRILFVYLALWLLLKVPALCVAPQTEGVWLAAGEIVVLFSGGWAVCIELGGMSRRTLNSAYMLFGAALLPIGLSHLVYLKITIDLVPAWLPFRVFWAALTGVGQMLCGIAVLSGVLRRFAAYTEAGMISLFTLLIWVPAAITQPGVRLNWTSLSISWILGAAAWCVATSVRRPAALPFPASSSDRRAETQAV